MLAGSWTHNRERPFSILLVCCSDFLFLGEKNNFFGGEFFDFLDSSRCSRFPEVIHLEIDIQLTVTSYLGILSGSLRSKIREVNRDSLSPRLGVLNGAWKRVMLRGCTLDFKVIILGRNSSDRNKTLIVS